MSRRILKWPVPVDDRDHPIGAGAVVHVGCQGDNPAVVQVWTDEWHSDSPLVTLARVYGTGQPIPEGDVVVGSVIVGPLVWHVVAAGVPS